MAYYLKQIREVLNLSKKQIAPIVGISRPTYIACEEADSISTKFDVAYCNAILAYIKRKDLSCEVIENIEKHSYLFDNLRLLLYEKEYYSLENVLFNFSIRNNKEFIELFAEKASLNPQRAYRILKERKESLSQFKEIFHEIFTPFYIGMPLKKYQFMKKPYFAADILRYNIAKHNITQKTVAAAFGCSQGELSKLLSENANFKKYHDIIVELFVPYYMLYTLGSNGEINTY